jgi:hypothetical protein
MDLFAVPTIATIPREGAARHPAAMAAPHRRVYWFGVNETVGDAR